MQRIPMKALFALMPMFAGCAAISGMLAGSIDEGIPRLRDRLPRTSKVYLADPVNAKGHMLHARGRRQVENAFGKALDGIGVAHSASTNGCDIAFRVTVDSWEYGDAGFAGLGNRDSITMSVVVMRRDTNRVLTRTSLFARNLDLLVKRYVEKLFEDEK
jgi:hypothetical protein